MADKKKGAPVAAAKPAPVAAAASTSKPATASNAKPAPASNVKRIPKPDEAQYEKEKKAIDEQIQATTAKHDELRNRINNADTGSPGGSKRKELIDEKQKIGGEARTLKDEKERLLKQFEDLKKIRDSKIKEAEDIKEKAGPYKTAEKIDQVINEMETKIRAGNLKLIEEKKFVAEIANLKKAKKNLEFFDKRNEELNVDKKGLDEVKAKLDAKSEEQRKVGDKLKEINDKLDQLKKDQEDDKAKITQLIEEKNQLKVKIDQLYEKKRQLYATFKQQREDFRAHQQEEILKKKEAQRLLREQMLDEKKKAFEAQRREERMIPKFVEEITTATNLTLFLQTSYLTEKAPESVTGEKKDLAVIEGMVALKSKADRTAEDTYFVGKAKKPQPQQKANKPVKKNDTIRLPLDMISQFALLSVPIPSVVADVEKTIKELQEKKLYFETKQEEALEKAKLEEEEEKAAASAPTSDAHGSSKDEEPKENGEHKEEEQQEEDEEKVEEEKVVEEVEDEKDEKEDGELPAEESQPAESE